MCGFVGSASLRYKVNESWLDEASEFLHNRGPDDSGKWISKDLKVGFAHRRLSIIDLSKNASQPFFDKYKQIGIVFNGEIYNFQFLKRNLERKGYQFFSNSDTEVLLHAYSCWGVKCLSKINGMFAFAIYDSLNKKIFAARDISGQKPFYYYLKNDSFFFGSSLETISSIPNLKKEICLKSLDYYLLSGYTPSETSLIKGIKKLLPANAMTYDLKNGDVNIWEYWKCPDFDKNLSFSKSSQITDLEQKFDSAVASQLVSDVPIGICLSGGLDSSLITAFASRHIPKVKTFTAIFPEDKKYDESIYANVIADYFSTEHHEIRINYPSIEILEKIKNSFDEPLADSSTIPSFLLFSELAKFCKVAIGGDGSDEIFGGYSHHSFTNKYLLRIVPTFFSNYLYKNYFEKIPLGFKGRNFSLNFYLKNLSFIPPYPLIFDFEARKKLFNNYLNYVPKLNEEFCTSFNNFKDFTNFSIRKDFNTYLSNDILVKTDRSSMANSLELRAPFLDKFLIEFCNKCVPYNLKAYKNKRKIILKEIAKNNLPRGFDINRKQGFSVPFSRWLKDKNFKNFVFEKLLSKKSFFDKEYIKSIIENQERGFSNSERIYSLLMLELWREKFNL